MIIEMKTLRGVLALFISYMIYQGWAVVFIILGFIFQNGWLSSVGGLVIAIWVGPGTPLIPLVIATAYFIQRYILRDKSRNLKKEKGRKPMEICKRNGYCISVDVLADETIEFSYYRLGSTNEESFYVSAASKYETSLLVDPKEKEHFLDALCSQSEYSVKKRPKSRDEILNAILLRFNMIESIEEIKNFLDLNKIKYEEKKWVEFYD
ncbi:MAG: hypothetical protein GX312_02805 [Candidatus Phytoplasma sp.]|nr:hypothetical protein [Phytoplasma sp.]